MLIHINKYQYSIKHHTSTKSKISGNYYKVKGKISSLTVDWLQINDNLTPKVN
jgi:hypothetical protein